VTTHQCGMSLTCKSTSCSHAKPHYPDDCESAAPCGNWPGMPHFQPRVCCIPVDQVQQAKDAIANRTTDPVVIGEKLRQTRLNLGLTQDEMARLFDIPVSRWSAVENGMEVKSCSTSAKA